MSPNADGGDTSAYAGGTVTFLLFSQRMQANTEAIITASETTIMWTDVKGNWVKLSVVYWFDRHAPFSFK